MNAVESTRAGRRCTYASYSKVKVEVVKGPDLGRSLEFAGRTVRIGTARDNDMILGDATVSRRHCAISATERGVEVLDEASTNGIFMGSMQVHHVVVSGPVTLHLGETQLSVTPLDEVVNREQAIGNRFGDLLGSTGPMRELFAVLQRVAPTDVNALIEGETGTGKELVAEAIHAASSRAKGPFVVFDCSAAAPSLVESELFGHERGAYTGAVAARAGVFELANRGTIFLDELGELCKELQPKLLRVLEKREVRRVGGTKTIPVDVRVVSATNRNLQAEVEASTFRSDLYFRVAGAHVVVPPLRDRPDDIPLLVEHFVKEHRLPLRTRDISEETWAMFRAHRWPGNVRELRNAVQRLLVTPERALGVAVGAPPSTPPSTEEIAPLRVARRLASDAFEQNYLRRLLESTGGSVSRAANVAEVSRQMIQKLMRKHGVR